MAGPHLTFGGPAISPAQPKEGATCATLIDSEHCGRERTREPPPPLPKTNKANMEQRRRRPCGRHGWSKVQTQRNDAPTTLPEPPTSPSRHPRHPSPPPPPLGQHTPASPWPAPPSSSRLPLLRLRLLRAPLAAVAPPPPARPPRRRLHRHGPRPALHLPHDPIPPPLRHSPCGARNRSPRRPHYPRAHRRRRHGPRHPPRQRQYRPQRRLSTRGQ